jgi:hypothetical protein
MQTRWQGLRFHYLNGYGPRRRPMAMRRNPERRMRLLIGPQTHPGPMDGKVPPLVMHLLTRPELLHHLQGLDKFRHALLAGDAPQRDLFEVIGQTDAQVQATGTDVIERDHIIGDIGCV